MLQDDYGYLWLATWDGLSRFDGSHFRNYFHDPNKQNSLPYFEISALALGKQNTIWILSNQICRYNPVADNFITYLPGKGNKISSSLIYSFATDSRKTLYILGDQGVERYDDKSDRFIRLRSTDKQLPDHHLKSGYIRIDKLNNMWILDHNSKILYKFKIIDSEDNRDHWISLEKKMIVPVNPDPTVNFRFQFKMLPLNSDTSLFISNNGLFIVDESRSISVQIRSPESNNLRGISEMFSWSFAGKVLVYSPIKGTTETITIGERYFIESYLIDKLKNIWVGGMKTDNAGVGLTRISSKPGKFEHLLDDSTFFKTKISVFAIYKDHRNHFLIGTKNFNSLIEIDPFDRLTENQFLPKEYRTKKIYPRAIIEDDNENLWIGSIEGHLFKSNATNNSFLSIPVSGTCSMTERVIPSFKVLKSFEPGRILVAGDLGVQMINENTNNVIKTFPNKSGDFYSLLVDRDSTVWAGNCGILYHLDRYLKPIGNYTINGGYYNIESICTGDSNTLWLTLLGGGICSFNKESHVTKSYTSHDGLSNNTVYEILKDSRNNLWISTDKGISMFNINTKQFINYGKEDGLDIEEFNSDAAYQDTNGKMYFGGVGGVVAFNPDSLNLNFQQSRLIFIDQLSAAGESTTVYYPFDFDVALVLLKGVTSIEIEFSNVEFTSPEKIKFRYRLKGFSDHWIFLEPGIRKFNIAGLRPGNFKLEFQVTDRQGNWTNNRSMEIKIPPFIYQTMIFKVSIEVIILFLVLLFLYMQFRNLRIKNKQKVTQMRLITIQEQLNPHFLSNALTALESFMAVKNESVTNEYICEMDRLMRTMIDYTGKEYVSFSDEISIIQAYLNIERLRLGKTFDYEIDIDKISDRNFLIAPSLIQPFIENSIKHGVSGLIDNSGFIQVFFDEPRRNHIVCYIEDNGVGLNVSQKKHKTIARVSKGLDIIYERYKIFNALYKTNLKFTFSELKSGEKHPGTIVRIEIPILKEKL